MSTDDSISEDVSSSGALSHGHASPDGDGGKESETSLVSSEGTSASGLAVSEERHATSQPAGGPVESRPMDITPACNTIRSLCLSTNEAFEQGKSLPFINPSSLETLRALVQEIQSSGETDPEMWKDCEGRWLHLFQLVEKQYQDQIVAQQEQYQCQIQLIQDEIKALVQLQNRPASVQPHAEFSPASLTKTTTGTKDYIFPLRVPKGTPGDFESLIALSPPHPPPQRPKSRDQAEERAATGLSSGYGTLSAWETGPEPSGSPGNHEEGCERRDKRHWSPNLQEDTGTNGIRGQQDLLSDPLDYQQKTSGTSQLLTSWAQRQKLKPKRSRAAPASSQSHEYEEQPLGPRESHKPTDLPDQVPRGSFCLRRSDSLTSEASGLTYWRLTESELYHPLPDSFDSGAYLLLQEASLSLSPSQEARPSLREIYKNKQRAEWEDSVTSGPSSPRVLTLDPAANQRQSDRTSGFTSPSHFSSPSFAAQPPHSPRAGTPDSTVESSPNPGDTDCISDASSASAAGPSPSDGQKLWGNAARAPPFTLHGESRRRPLAASQQRGAAAPLTSEEEEGSNTHTSTVKPRPASAGGPHAERAASLEDPVVLSLLRQNLREKHSRHVADLKAYYESEIQVLRDKLNLRDLPRDLEESNQALAERCKHLEEALAEATGRIRHLQASNGLLEKKLAAWPERYAVAGAAVKTLQQRLEDGRRSGKEKDASVARLKARARQLEEALQKSCREAAEGEARREREYKMLQDLLGQYDSLGKEHEGLKNNLVSTENKLVDATDQISDLKRVISKLESQVKQLEHENQARARYSSHSSTQPSGAGLLHHPDLLRSPGKSTAQTDVPRRKSPSDKSPLPQTTPSSVHKKSPYLSNDQSSGPRSSVDSSSAGGSWRCASPPECEQALPQQSPREAARREGTCSLTPMMRALIQLEETRATESRAPWVGSQRSSAERRHKEAIQEGGGLQADWEAVKPGGAAPRAERGGGGGGRGAAARRAAALLRAQRSLSPDGHRSSSLPPEHRNKPSTTPTKRGTLLMPMSAKSSPKRCPTENYSTAFGHPMPREQHLHKSPDGEQDQRRHSFHSGSPRKRLVFPSADGARPEESFQLGWEDRGVWAGSDQQDPWDASAPLLRDGPPSLAEAEKLLDELTQEKLQVEGALSRMPRAGGRVTLQTRLDEVALENRLETLNRELGSIRMTLKRFHVLRSSANT
ncbi:M-phase phosphoprotein 9 isoform X2 [Pungitius pungitius]|uniref:M-phase phosphoprotein 9 isoform X2 n=1 Tax=Pungitius pungitius TaxID=134920 RepID=UPI002E0FA49E